MNKTRILSIVFLIISIGLAYYLYASVKSDIELTAKIERVESQVIEKLKMIRAAEVAYQSVNGQYTSDFSKLISFIDTGKIYLIQKKEHVVTLEYGADSSWYEVDTLGSVQVKDSLFSSKYYPTFDSKTLALIPEDNKKKFELFADKITKSGVTVDVFECRDVSPVNPKRRAKNNEKALRVGSRTEVTTAGNWE